MYLTLNQLRIIDFLANYKDDKYRSLSARLFLTVNTYASTQCTMYNMCIYIYIYMSVYIHIYVCMYVYVYMGNNTSYKLRTSYESMNMIYSN